MRLTIVQLLAVMLASCNSKNHVPDHEEFAQA